MASRFGWLFLLPLSVASYAADLGLIRDVSLAPSNQVRLVIALPPGNVERFCLQSASSPVEQWSNEPDFQVRAMAEGCEFLTPHRSYYSQRYYRFAEYAPYPLLSQGLPYLRFISPSENVRTGQTVTLFGANFAANPTENRVVFELPNQSWTAAVVEAKTNYLVAVVPTNLVVSSASTGTLYRVTVTTDRGTGNGVGCQVKQTSYNAFKITPEQVFIAQPPGSGKQVLVIGGGTPPYHLQPQRESDLKIAVARQEGPLIEVNAISNVTFGGITLVVQDSQTEYAYQTSANVNVLTIPYEPGFEAAFHTLLAGTAPGVTFTVKLAGFSNGNFQTERLALHLQNVSLEVGELQPGAVAGLLRVFDPSGGYIYAHQHLTIKHVATGRAAFEVASLADGDEKILADGELIEHPPTVLINVHELPPGSLVPQPAALALTFEDRIFRLPADADASFSVTSRFSSVSAREELYLPQQKELTNQFRTAGLAPGSPRIERLLPIHGEIYHQVRLQGTGFGATPADNEVTFAGLGKTRIRGEISVWSESELVVTVPEDAVTGPVAVSVNGKTSNEFSFWVRFHPQTALVFESFAANTPTGVRILHQQPVDDDETAGEVPLRSIICDVGGGHLSLSNMVADQVVGNVVSTSFYNGDTRTNLIVFTGRDSANPARFLFRDVSSPGSRYVFATLACENTANGVKLDVVSGEGLFSLGAGVCYDFHFADPIYIPPPGSGMEVAIRVEALSQPWTSFPENPMRVIWHSVQRVQ